MLKCVATPDSAFFHPDGVSSVAALHSIQIFSLDVMQCKKFVSFEIVAISLTTMRSSFTRDGSKGGFSRSTAHRAAVPAAATFGK